MSGLLFLHLRDLQIRGDSLCIVPEPKGMTLVMFYSKECKYCETLFSQFKQLPYVVQGCQFAIFNVGMNPDIVQLSSTTICPITYVPDVILYVDGVPTIRYDGEHDLQAIQTFLNQMYKKLQKSSFIRPSPESSLPNHPPTIRTGVESQGRQEFTDPRAQQFMENQQQKTPQSYLPQTPQYIPQTNQSNRFSNPPSSQNSQNIQNSPPNAIYQVQPLQTPRLPSTAPPYSQNRVPAPPAPPQNQIPAYTIGKPVCGSDGKCYLSFDHAYGQKVK